MKGQDERTTPASVFVQKNKLSLCLFLAGGLCARNLSLEAKCKSLGAAMLLDAATDDVLSETNRLQSFGSVEINGLAEPVAVFGKERP